MSQLHSHRVRGSPLQRNPDSGFPYTLCPDNGGNSGADYWILAYLEPDRSSCSSEGHSAPARGRDFHLNRSLCRRFDAYSSSSQLFTIKMRQRRTPRQNSLAESGLGVNDFALCEIKNTASLAHQSSSEINSAQSAGAPLIPDPDCAKINLGR